MLAGDPLALGELLRIPIQYRPKAIFASGMQLLEGMRQRLRDLDGCPVLDVYSLVRLYVNGKIGLQKLGELTPFKLLEAAQEHHQGLSLVLALSTGLRPSEYLALLWKDIDLDLGRLVVQRSLYRVRKGGWRFEPPKTKGSHRTVTLPAGLVVSSKEDFGSESGKHRDDQEEQLGGLYCALEEYLSLPFQAV